METCLVLQSVLLLLFLYTSNSTAINDDQDVRDADSYFLVRQGKNLTNGFNVFELPRDKRALGFLLRGFMESMGYTVAPVQLASLMNPSTAATGQMPTAAVPPTVPTMQPAGSASSPKPAVANSTQRQRETIKFTGVVNFGNTSNANLLDHLKRYETIFHGPKNATAAPPPMPAPVPPPRPPPTKPPNLSWKPPIDPRSLPPLLEPYFVKIPLPIAPDLKLLSAVMPFKKTSEKEYSNHEDVEKYEEESKEIDSPLQVKMYDPPDDTSRNIYNYNGRKPIESDSEESEETEENDREEYQNRDAKKSEDEDSTENDKHSENDKDYDDEEEEEEEENRPKKSQTKYDDSDDDYPVKEKSDSHPKPNDYKKRKDIHDYKYRNKSHDNKNQNEESHDEGSVEEERYPPEKYNKQIHPSKDYSESTEEESDPPEKYYKSQATKNDEEEYDGSDVDDDYPGFKKFTDFGDDDEDEEARSPTIKKTIKNIPYKPEIKDNERLPISYDREKSKHDQPIQDSYGEFLEKPGNSDERVSSYFSMFKDTGTEPYKKKNLPQRERQPKKISSASSRRHKSDYNPKDGYDRIKNEYTLPAENKYEEYELENKQYPKKSQQGNLENSNERLNNDKTENNYKRRLTNRVTKKAKGSNDFTPTDSSKKLTNNRGSHRYSINSNDGNKTTLGVNDNYSKSNDETGSEENHLHPIKINSTNVEANKVYKKSNSSGGRYRKSRDYDEQLSGKFGDKVSNKTPFHDTSRQLRLSESKKQPGRFRTNVISQPNPEFEERSGTPHPEVDLPERIIPKYLHESESKETQMWPARFDYTDLKPDNVHQQTKQDVSSDSVPQKNRRVLAKQTSKVDKNDKKYDNVTKLSIKGHVLFHQPNSTVPIQNQKNSRREEMKKLHPNRDDIREPKEKVSKAYTDKPKAPDENVKFINSGYPPNAEVNFDNIHDYYPIPGYSRGPDIYSQFFPANGESYSAFTDYGDGVIFADDYTDRDGGVRLPQNPNPNYVPQQQIIATTQLDDPESAREFFDITKSDYDFSTDKLPTRKVDNVQVAETVTNTEGNGDILPIIPEPAPYYYDERLTEFTDEPESDTEVLKEKREELSRGNELETKITEILDNLKTRLLVE